MPNICMSFPFRLNQQGGIATSTIGTNAHIEEHITQILTTRKGERAMNLEYGCDVDFSLFENIDSSLARILIYEVVEALNSQEPRIEVKPDDLAITYEDSTVNISLKYTLKVDGSVNEYNIQL